MTRNLYITTVEAQSGKSAITLGVMQLLLSGLQRVAFFRPIILQDEDLDNDINLVLNYFNLDIPYESTYAYTLRQARDLINQGKHDQLMDTILSKYKELEKNYDWVLVEGTDFQATASSFEFDINAEIADNLGCPLFIVLNSLGKSDEDLISSALMSLESFKDKGLDVLGLTLNRYAGEDAEAVGQAIRERGRNGKKICVSVIPEDATLSKPSMSEVQKCLNAEVLYGGSRMEALVHNYVVAAMHIDNFLEYLEKDSLIITPGDRSDIILSSLVARVSAKYPDVAGIVLTGGIRPTQKVAELIEGWTGGPLAVLLAPHCTFTTALKLYDLYGRIDAGNQRKIATALGLFETHVNVKKLSTWLVADRPDKMTPKMFEFSLIQKATSDRRRIVLPEGEGERILKATEMLLRRGIADITLLGREDRIQDMISKLGVDVSGAEIIDPTNSPDFEEFCNTFYELRKHKGATEDSVRDIMADPTYYGTMMVYKGKADGMVSGSVTTTAQTILPALQFIKTKPGVSTVSSVFFMCLRDRVLVYGDCAVNPDPTAEQLADIALTSAQTAKLFGVEPRVAMLSYSTGASGQGEDVNKVRQATEIAKRRAPNLPIEGPLQYDAAVDPDVAATKLPGSDVAGHASVFIFPDLNTGNNTYKAVQRSSGAVAMGPILQGLRRPVNDLSRGCTVIDVVYTTAITAIQAQEQKGVLG